MKCAKCNSDIKEDCKFCSECGEKIPQKTILETTCPNIDNNVICGHTICNNENFCSGCGWKIIEKAFGTGTYMCIAGGNECKNLLGPDEKFCNKCGGKSKKSSTREETVYTENADVQRKSSEEEVVDSDLSQSTLSQERTSLLNQDIKKNGTRKGSDTENLLGDNNSDRNSSPDVYPVPSFLTESSNEIQGLDKTSKNKSQENDKLGSEACNTEKELESEVQRDEGNQTEVETNQGNITASQDTVPFSSNKFGEDAAMNVNIKVPTETSVKTTQNNDPDAISEVNSNRIKIIDEDNEKEDNDEVSKKMDEDVDKIQDNVSGSSEDNNENQLKTITKDEKDDIKNKTETLSVLQMRQSASRDENVTKTTEVGDGTGRNSKNEYPIDKSTPADDSSEKKTPKTKIPKSGIERLHPMSTRSSSRKTNIDELTIEFHAIASKAFLADSKNTKVGIRFNIEELGGWTRVWFADTVRELENDEGHEVFLRMVFPKHLLKTKFLEYRYCVKLPNASELNEEYFYHSVNRNKDDALNRRKIYWNTNFGDLWQQYDGVINPIPEKGVLQWLKDVWDDYENSLLINLKTFMKHCSPLLDYLFQRTNSTASEVLHGLEMMFKSLEETYFYPLKYWKKGQQRDDFRNLLIKDLCEALNPYLIRVATDKQMDVSTGMLLLYLSTEYQFTYTCDASKAVIFESFLLDTSLEEKISPKYEKLKEDFGSYLKNCEKALENAITSEKDSEDPVWLCCIPVYHFLKGECKPFDELPNDFSHNAEKPKWWGKIGTRDAMEYLKGKTNWKRSPHDMLRKLAPMFELDYLLPRTFVAVLQLDKLDSIVSKHLIPPEVVLAGFYFYLITNVITKTEASVQSGINCLKEVTTQLRCMDGGFDMTQTMKTRILITNKICTDVLKATLMRCSKVNQPGLAIALIETFLVSESLLEKKIVSDGSGVEESLKHFGKKISQIKGWIKTFAFEDLVDHLNVWNKVIGLEISSNRLRQHFLFEMKQIMESCLSNRMASSGPFENLMTVYCEGGHKYHESVQDVLGKVAIKALGKGKFSHKTELSENSKYGEMMSELFKEKWEEIGKNSSLLYFALSWPPMIHFFKIFYEKNVKGILTNNCQRQLADVALNVERALEDIKSGSIRISDLKLIRNAEDRFMEMNFIIWRFKNSQKDIKDTDMRLMRCFLVQRLKELEKLHEIYANLRHFAQLCQHFEANLPEISELSSLKDDMQLNQVMKTNKTVEEKDIESISSYNPEIELENIPTELIKSFPKLKKLSEGTIFLSMWIKRGSERKAHLKESMNVETVFNSVWDYVKKNWEQLRDKLQSGEITFKEFESHFGKMDMEAIKKELEFFSSDMSKNWIEERYNQIQQYRILQQCLSGAVVILEFVKEFNLRGNFSAIERIFEMEANDDIPMKELDEKMMKTCEILREIQMSEIDCLRIFIECKRVVLWLRKYMRNLQELNVFADLATMTAGEGDMEVDKVNFLHSATRGYAALIFGLNESCGYNEFIERCKQVWKELAVDPNLPEKMKDTNRNLDWFDGVRQSQGSVEVSSMELAKAINAAGIYVVGKLQRDSLTHKLNVEDVLQLHIQEESQEQRLRRKYQYKELQELQSKLMLVAGKAEKGKEDVDRFTMVLDSVVRLCNVYIRLVESGCVLFTNWQARFLCDPCRPVCAFIKFGTGKECMQLKGRRNDTDDVITVMPEIAKFMEYCLQEWLSYLDAKRDEYYHLNYFTIDQVVILQRELALFNAGEEISNLCIPLLSIVNNNCTYRELTEAMRKANEDVEDMEIRDEENKLEKESKFSTEDIVANFIQEMVEAGQKEIVAKAALEYGNIDPKDIDEGLLWCIENERIITTEREEKRKSAASKLSLEAASEQILNTLSSSGESAIGPLIKDLKHLWTTFQTSVSSNLADYLSVEHLGIVLKYISKKGKVAIDRDFLQCFQKGVPNLLVCRQDDVINTILSIYCQDTNQPLPNPDEVLLCTKETKLDEVEIFWRRAMSKECGKIYCLANVEQLSYDVSDKGERRLDHHMQNAFTREVQYRLVVICGSEQESNSRIVAALDKYRRPPLPLMSYQALLPCVREKLTVDITTMLMVPAAAVDFECCSVRVIKSWRSGVGKTLYKRRLVEKLNLIHKKLDRADRAATITIPIHEKQIEIDEIMSVLLKNTSPKMKTEPRIFHIDLSHEVEDGVDYLLFQLLILGCLTDSYGYVWRKSPYDLYLVESLPILSRNIKMNQVYKCLHRCLDILPDVVCRSPSESFEIYKGYRKPEGFRDSDVLFDQHEFESIVFQRPFQYLHRMETGQSMTGINLKEVFGTPQGCLQTFLRHCGVVEPSWSELRNFVWFLNTQLLDFESSDYVSEAAAEFLPGFAKFVLKFLIQMSRDFATRSLNLSEETPTYSEVTDKEETKDYVDVDITKFQMRRTWENSPHPYLFFNPDHNTMTFVGFTIDRWTGNLVDYQTKKIIEKAILPKDLGIALHQNDVNMNENFDRLTRQDKLEKLCSVMGLKRIHDPDSSYELTMDNVKKILAIYMRFRCDIPVIIMGETGCGKTRLIQFMCQLQCPDVKNVKNMLVMKVHGGTKKVDIIKKVKEAEIEARKNSEKENTKNMFTVLFFDEANTTEAIGVIKEIMCDKTICGEPLNLCQSLKIVAACNPYKKHSKKMIERLEQAGLGYHVDADNTADRMGRIPMRRLVYRVQPLPQSMLPLVWDFGQLATNVEEMYTRQMILRYIDEGKIPDVDNIDNTLSHILTVAQEFMRKQKDECSFVSLRDVERVLIVFSWFYNQYENGSLLLDMLNKSSDSDESMDEDDVEEDKSDTDEDIEEVTGLTKALVLALGVCYHASLNNRDEFRHTITKTFDDPFCLPGGSPQMLDLIDRCQDVFLDNVRLDENIAKNKALKENVFMMLVCIELRIPLFLVGKPGSSKSLAKTIIADAMQGNSSYSWLFRNYKQVKMVSFQCSPLSIAEGIIATFRQCAKYQKDGDLKKFVSVVVLDEVGLAEDSPKMPLKTLHPLLENGCLEDEEPEQYKKVAFIGISNWALDPAKMNRGILVQRETPDLDELIETAKGICSEEKQFLISPLIKLLALAYLDIFKAVLKKREFFGLRDFYSLIKMIYSFTVTNKKRPTWLMLEHSIRRNFGGMEEKETDPVEVFANRLDKLITRIDKPTVGDPDCSPTGLIKACLREKQSRYLLLLTENYGALSVLQQKVLKMNAITIFGSSFQSDQQYTQVCRNINRIKVCMETGATVILLNLENLYESLYDALNQYYVYLGGERYVDLGLGSHRVKCRVHKNFRLIVVAEKEVVYKKFPIPLINRLEKHFLNISTMLSPLQMEITETLEKWTEDFVTPLYPVQAHHFKGKTSPKLTKMDVFIGYHADTCASIVLHVCHELCGEENIETDIENERTNEEEAKEFEIYDRKIEHIKNEILENSKDLLLWCVTPDAVLRLGTTKLEEFEKEIREKYFFDQKHESLSSYFSYHLAVEKSTMRLQISTHSKLLTTGDLEDMSTSVDINVAQISLLSLQSFDTEQQFCRQLRLNFEKNLQDEMFLIVQCENGIENANLIACARYCVLDEIQQLSDARQERTHIVFVIHLPRMSSGHFSGFQCGIWKTVHIDDIKNPDNDIPRITEMVGKSIGTLLERATNARTVMDQSVRESSTPEQEEVVESMLNEDEDDLNDHTKQAAIQTNFNFPALVKMCVHSSLAMIKDPDDPGRATHRVKLLIRLLHDIGKRDSSFMKGVCSHLCKLMKEKEDEVTGDSANIWLTSEATSRDHINRVGTFRKAMTQCVVDKLSPLLAGIISKIDTNRNLDILEESESLWKQRLWLEIMNSPKATDIKYSMFISPQGIKQITDYNVLGTGFDGHVFSAKMPFSWIIFKLVQNTLQTQLSVKSDGTDSNNPISLIATIIENLPMGKILNTCLQGVQMDELLNAYIPDFIHMVYPQCSDEELQLVCADLGIGCRLLLNDQQPDSAVPWIVAIHLAYENSNVLFQNFNSITQVWPNCSSAVKEYLSNEENKGMITNEEQILDVLGLCLLVRNVEPKVDTFTDAKGRQKWVSMVNRYRPIVERILDQDVYSSPNNGNSKRESGLLEARYQWTRATVLKLFLEHVCSTNDFHAKRCMTLWKMLKGDANLKTVQYLEKIEKLLKICMTEAMKKAFGDQEICKSCESKISERPIQLPCGDVICVRCFKEAPITGQTCPVCHSEFPEDFCPLDTEICSPEIKEFNTFKKSCNSFYMDIVSQLCFSDDKPPSQEVIEKLMAHITTSPQFGNTEKVMSKEISIFDEGIDPSPVFRSFLLQHLLRTSIQDVENYLEKYLLHAKNLFKNEESSLLELSVMIINCLEDSFTQECSKSSNNKNTELKMAVKMLTNNVQRLHSEPFGIAKLLRLSESRFGLKIAADWLYKSVVISKSRKITKQNIKRILDATEKFCTECGLSYPRLFIIKYLCRCYGVESFQAICSSNIHGVVKQIDLPELHMDDIIQCMDRFIVCGRMYQNVREAIIKSIFGKTHSPLKLTLEEMQDSEHQPRVILLLALFREISMSNLFDPQDKRRISGEQTRQYVEGFLAEHSLFKDQKEILESVCRNTMLGETHQEWIKQGIDLRQQNMICLIFHFFVTILEIPTKETILEPLAQLTLEPTLMKDALFPTMPQDETEDFRNIVYAASSEEGQPVAYRCPNGHIYFIGDCGEPTTFSKCPDCGQKVGGENYKLQKRNKLDEGEDTTEKGHILGDADSRQQVATPERDLSPLQCAVLKLFTHMSMYLGGCSHPKVMQRLIKPNIPEDKIRDYLWRHMEVDILILQTATGRSAEDVYLLLHFICRNFMTENKAQLREKDVGSLTSKAARSKWEQMFATLFLKDIFKDMDNIIHSLNDEMEQDERLGSDPLTCLLIEEDVSEKTIDLNELHNMPVVWRYRSQITISHLSRTFLAQAPENSFQILRIFLDEEHHLKAIRLIPSIIKLQRLLIQLLQDRLDKSDAVNMTIEKMLKREGKERDFDGLVSDFFEAWRCVKEHLATFTFLTPKGNRQLPIECSHKVITEKDEITYLLPTFQDNGLCSYALLYFLLKKQNTFLMEYCKKRNFQYKDLPKVHLKDLTTADLICFHPTKDILPMVMANCQYIFEVEKGMRIQYNFAELERQLMDRILFSKSVIIMPESEFPVMTYASERTNASVFRELRRNVKQEPLAPVVVHQMCNEFKSYPDICDALRKLDIAISFLKSIGGDIEMNLESFMTKTLQIENPFPTQKVKMSCSCKHAQALWIALTLMKTKNQSCFQEDAFEGISADFRKEMDDQEKTAVQNMCKGKEIPLEKINCLVDMMFECILLQITIPTDEDFDMAALSLRDTLTEYSQAPCYDIIPPKVQDAPDVTDLIQKIPASILNTKATDVWLCIYTMYTEKARPRR